MFRLMFHSYNIESNESIFVLLSKYQFYSLRKTKSGEYSTG